MAKEVLHPLCELGVICTESNFTRIYEFLDQYSPGDFLRGGPTIKGYDIILQITPPLPDEADAMQKSLAKKREHAFIQAGDNKTLIEGGDHYFDPDSVYFCLDQIGARTQNGIFSHTHWDRTLNPLPSLDWAIFGDVGAWRMLRGAFPNLKCRVVFHHRGGFAVLEYLGDFQDFSPDQ